MLRAKWEDADIVLSNALAVRLPLLALGLTLWASTGLADVIEIGAGGSVTVYRGPAIYTSEGVRPINRPAAVAAPSTVRDLIRSAAARQSLDSELLEAVAWRESGFRHAALSPKGATGVMQIMPATAAALGVDRFDLRQNVEGGAMYLRLMLNRYSGSVPLALAAYNAGPGAVDRYRAIPPFRETQAYVAAIVGRIASGAGPSISSPRLIEP